MNEVKPPRTVNLGDYDGAIVVRKNTIELHVPTDEILSSAEESRIINLGADEDDELASVLHTLCFFAYACSREDWHEEFVLEASQEFGPPEPESQAHRPQFQMIRGGKFKCNPE